MRAKRSGFSRWELLALGAVISTGGAFLLPVLAQTVDEQRTTENANASRCMNNLKQVGLSLSQYLQDFDEKMPRVALSEISKPQGSFSSVAYGWAEALQPYIRTTVLYQCPAESHAGQNDPMKPGYTDYWMNTNVAGVSLSHIHSATALITFGDGDGGAINSNARYSLNKAPRNWLDTPKSPVYRHMGKANYVFVDGHVKRCSFEVFFPDHPTLELK